MFTQRPILLTVPLLMLLFLGGGVLGVRMAEHFAPQSFLAAFVGLFMLPLAFAGGMQFWLGFALIIAIGHGVRHLFRLARGATVRRPIVEPVMVPPGSIAFLPCALLASAVGGLITSVLASEAGFFRVWFTYLAVGVFYGSLCWRLARAGWLPFPEDA